MFDFTDNEIQGMHVYAHICDGIITDFYDPLSAQPKADLKSHMRTKYKFQPVAIGFETFENNEGDGDQFYICSRELAGDTRVLADSAAQAGFIEIARYTTGTTAVTFIGVKENDNWQILRTWQEDRNERLHWKSLKKPVNVQPNIFLDAGQSVMAWSVPLLPIIKELGSPVSFATDIFNKVFAEMGLDGAPYMMGLLKTGVGLLTDPHNAIDGSVDTVKRVIDNYKEATKDYSLINNRFDYLVDDQWAQYVQYSKGLTL